MELVKRLLIIIIVLAFMITILSLPGCKVIEKVEYRTIYDTCYISKIEHDSVYVKDSTYIFTKADTVFLIKYKERLKYLTKTDTIFRVSKDTLYLNKEIIKEVEKKRPARDIMAKFGVLSFLALIALIILKFVKRK